jgi:hypothetical protein
MNKGVETIPEDYTGFQPFTPDELRALIKSYQWIFAKTMPQCPHWYALRKNARSDLQFRRFVKQIRLLGYDERWGPHRHRYLDLDGWKYWTMGYQIESTLLINRAKIELPAVRDLFAPAGEKPWREHPKRFQAKAWHGKMYGEE